MGQLKDKYNEREYARYTIRVRRDSDLYEQIERFMRRKGTSLNYIVTKLLTGFFDQDGEDESEAGEP